MNTFAQTPDEILVTRLDIERCALYKRTSELLDRELKFQAVTLQTVKDSAKAREERLNAKIATLDSEKQALELSLQEMTATKGGWQTTALVAIIALLAGVLFMIFKSRLAKFLPFLIAATSIAQAQGPDYRPPVSINGQKGVIQQIKVDAAADSFGVQSINGIHTIKIKPTTWGNLGGIPSNLIYGTGSDNYLPKYSGPYNQSLSQIIDNGTTVAIGTVSPNAGNKLEVNGTALASQVRGGSNSSSVNIFSYMGVSPRVATSGTSLDLMFGNDLYFYSTGDLQRARLTTTGLKIGTGSPSYPLHVGGNIGYEGAIFAGLPTAGIPLSNGTTGQFLKRLDFAGFAYNKWENIGIPDVANLQTNLDAKLPLANVNGTTNNIAKFTGSNTLGNSVIFENGRVGISTPNPNQMLEVVGVNSPPAASGSSADGFFRFRPTGSNLSLDGGGNSVGNVFTWLQSRAGNNFAINYGLALNPNGGFVSIGHSGGQGKLDVLTGGTGDLSGYSIIRSSASSAYQGGLLLTNHSLSTGYSFKMTSSFNSSTSAGARFGFVANNATETFLNSGPATEYRYNGDILLAPNNGNVAIGHSTPISKLDANGTFTLRSGTIYNQIIPAVNVNGVERSLRFSSNTANTTEGYQFHHNTTGNLIFVRFDGNVSIGSGTMPNYKLDVDGTGHFTQNLTLDANAIIPTAPSIGTHATNKTYVDSKTWSISAVTGLQTALDSKLSGSGTANYLAKYTAGLTQANSQIFDNGTNIGIGTTTPGAKLQVNGAGVFQGNVSSSGQISAFRFAGSGATPSPGTAGAGLGSFAAVNIAGGSDTAFRLNITAGDSPSAGADIISINFGGGFTSVPYVTFSEQSDSQYYNGDTSANTRDCSVYIKSVTTSGFVLALKTNRRLITGQSYSFTFHTIQ